MLRVSRQKIDHLVVAYCTLKSHDTFSVTLAFYHATELVLMHPHVCPRPGPLCVLRERFVGRACLLFLQPLSLVAEHAAYRLPQMMLNSIPLIPRHQQVHHWHKLFNVCLSKACMYTPGSSNCAMSLNMHVMTLLHIAVQV
jgi:hypothetical protein